MNRFFLIYQVALIVLNMSDILISLPSSLQIMTFKYLVHPNERVLLIGNPGVGKTSFIRRLNSGQYSSRYVPTDSIVYNPINSRVNVVEIGGQWRFSSSYEKATNPTRIIIMADVTSKLSINDIIGFYIPRYRHYNVPITVIFNKTDVPRRDWRQSELSAFSKKLATLSQEIRHVNVVWTSLKNCDDTDMNVNFQHLMSEF